MNTNLKEPPAKKLKRDVNNFETKQISVGSQVDLPQSMLTYKSMSLKQPFPSLAIWCRWLNDRFCVSTQTPIKNKKPRAKVYKLVKGTPPLFDPLTGLEISGQTSLQSVPKDETDNLSIIRSEHDNANPLPEGLSKQVQTIEAELLQTKKITCVGTPTLPPPSDWCKWIDGRISLGSQTPRRRIRKRPGRKSKRSLPLVDPLTGLVIESGNTSLDCPAEEANKTIESKIINVNFDIDDLISAEMMEGCDDSSSDSTQLCIVEYQDACVQVDLPPKHPKRLFPNFKQGPHVADWTLWPDGRQSRSSQTALNPKTRKRKQRNRIRETFPLPLS